jgi:hypothetical protein
MKTKKPKDRAIVPAHVPCAVTVSGAEGPKDLIPFADDDRQPLVPGGKDSDSEFRFWRQERQLLASVQENKQLKDFARKLVGELIEVAAQDKACLDSGKQPTQEERKRRFSRIMGVFRRHLDFIEATMQQGKDLHPLVTRSLLSAKQRLEEAVYDNDK